MPSSKSLQIKHLHKTFDRLQVLHGDKNLNSIYGGGNIQKPKIMFVFMNPTKKNISSALNWKGIRAPWLGTKNVWKLFNLAGLLKDEIYCEIKSLNSDDWSTVFCEKIYSALSDNSLYITNLAKCTQYDARPLKDKVFVDYLPLLFEEINCIQPQKIVTFGNQVSSIVLGKRLSVRNYLNTEQEEIRIYNKKYRIYPTYYPVGQGQRNMPLAVKRIQKITVA